MKKKEAEDKCKADDMRRAAMEGMSSTFGRCYVLVYCE